MFPGEDTEVFAPVGGNELFEVTVTLSPRTLKTLNPRPDARYLHLQMTI